MAQLSTLGGFAQPSNITTDTPLKTEPEEKIVPRQPDTRLKIANLCAVLKLHANLNELEKAEAIQLKAEIERLTETSDSIARHKKRSPRV